MITDYFYATLRTLSLLCILAAPCALQAGQAKQKLPLLDRIVASVNNEAITESELNRQTKLLAARLQQTDADLPPLPTLHKQLLEKMILEKLQLQLATEQGIDVEPAAVNQTIKEMASRDGLSVHQMEQFLEEQGISPNQFRETIKREMTLAKLQQKEVGQKITISKAEIENFLSSPTGSDQLGVEYRLGHILIALPGEESLSPEQIQSLQTKAEMAVKELKAGANFAKTAIAKSAGQQAFNGGDLGWRTIGEIPTIFAKIVPTLHEGEIYGPIRDNSGFHIIKLLDKRKTKAMAASSEAARNKALETLYQRKFDEFLVSWLRTLRAESEVKTYLNEP